MFTRIIIVAAFAAGAHAAVIARGDDPAVYGGDQSESIQSAAAAAAAAPAASISSSTSVTVAAQPSRFPVGLLANSTSTFSSSLPLNTSSSSPTAPAANGTLTQAALSAAALDASQTSLTSATITINGQVFTTYCPEDEALSLLSSASGLAPAATASSSASIPGTPSASSTATADPVNFSQAPFGTGIALSTGTLNRTTVGLPSGVAASLAITNKTVTYTQGTGASATVITATVRSTSTIYLTTTIFTRTPSGTANPADTAVQVSPEETALSDAAPDASSPLSVQATSTGFKTVKSTSTFTQFVTVFPVRSQGVAAQAVPTAANAPAASAAVAATDCTCAANTVTVHDKETVYVTLPAATVTQTGRVVAPLQSSTSVYYPTVSALQAPSGVAQPSNTFVTSSNSSTSSTVVAPVGSAAALSVSVGEPSTLSSANAPAATDSGPAPYAAQSAEAFDATTSTTSLVVDSPVTTATSSPSVITAFVTPLPSPLAPGGQQDAPAGQQAVQSYN